MFYVLHITKASDNLAHEFYSFDSVEAAQEKYHSLLAYVYNAAVMPTLDYFCTEILDGTGLPVERKAYTKPVPIPELEEIVEDKND